MNALSYTRKRLTLKCLDLVLACFRKVVPYEFLPNVRPFRENIDHALDHIRAERELEQLAAEAPEPLNIELAPARRELDGWIPLGWGTRYPVDLRLALPLPDNSVARVYSSHLLEHIPYPHPFEQLLKECHRVLVPGGTFEAAVPNAGTIMQNYATGGAVLPESMKGGIDPGEIRCRIDEANWYVFQHNEHMRMYDEENLVLYLEDAGFEQARVRPFDPSIDMECRRDESVFVIARKPKA